MSATVDGSLRRTLTKTMLQSWHMVEIGPRDRRLHGLDELHGWCYDNCTGKWSDGYTWITSGGITTYVFCFKSRNDHIAFTLAWKG